MILVSIYSSIVNSNANAAQRTNANVRNNPMKLKTLVTTSIATERHPVVTDIARLLVGAEIANSCAKTGRSGCTAYISRKVEKPAVASARFTRRNAGVPGVTCMRRIECTPRAARPCVLRLDQGPCRQEPSPLSASTWKLIPW